MKLARYLHYHKNTFYVHKEASSATQNRCVHCVAGHTIKYHCRQLVINTQWY